jgi:hypothetical protein
MRGCREDYGDLITTVRLGHRTAKAMWELGAANTEGVGV